MMLTEVFVFGVIVPALVTVIIFIGFLFCWFKLGVRDHFAKQSPTTRGQQSACSSDSLCDITGSTSCGSDTQHSISVHKANVIDDMSCVIERDMMTQIGRLVDRPLDLDRTDCTKQRGPVSISDGSCTEFIQTDLSDRSVGDNYSHVEPNYGHVKPNCSHVKPNCGHVEPNYGQVKPNYGHVKPKCGHEKPNYGHGKPKCGHVEPNYGHVEPNYGHVEPNYGHMKPNHGHVKPNYGHVEPNYGHVEPNYGHVEPNYGHVEPNYAITCRPGSVRPHPLPYDIGGTTLCSPVSLC